MVMIVVVVVAVVVVVVEVCIRLMVEMGWVCLIVLL